ncbi:MAG TPA: chemotaxis protein CheW [Candidatus Obscuribacterales bacterium]
MKTGKSVVVFLVEGYRYGMPLEMVERVAPVVEVTPVPDTPDSVMGIINVRGKVLPVINVRKKLQMADRQLKLSDQLLICHVGERTLAVLVDAIEGALEYDDEQVTKSEGDGQDVLKTEEGVVYIYDYERLLNSQDQKVLNKAIEKVTA